jgi:predicted negative regulator of RcsB-dependent stress response
MKADRRHELQQNELADWLGEKIEQIKPYATQIALGVALLLLVIAGGMWWYNGSDQATAATWSDLFTARNQPRDSEKALDAFANQKTGTPAALWARMTIGDFAAEQGGRAMFTDRTEAKKQLDKAEAEYKAVEAGTNDEMLKSRARLGLAKVNETLCKPDEARKYYELVATSLKDSAIGKAAAADAARLKSPDQIALLAWFAKEQPKRPLPFPGMGGNIPGLPNDLPARPDISLPNVPNLGLDNIGTGTPTTPPPDFPAPVTPGTTPPVTPAPDATTPPTTPDGKTEPAKPEAPKTGTETPKTETPKTESPKTEAPKTETPATEAPKTETPKAESPKSAP